MSILSQVHNAIQYFTPFTQTKPAAQATGPVQRILKPEQTQKVQSLFAQEPERIKACRKSVQIEHSVIKTLEGDLFALQHAEDGYLGEGASGLVKKAQNLQDGSWWACKIIHTDDPYSMVEDTALLKELGQYKGQVHRVDTDKLYLFMPLSPGKDLEQTLYSSRSNFSINEKMNMALTSVKEAQRLHEAGVLHRDIRLANLVYDPHTYSCAMVDFGMAKPMNSLNEYISESLQGAPMGLAPELLSQADGHFKAGAATHRSYTYDARTEVFALGIALAEAFTVDIDKSNAVSDLKAELCYIQWCAKFKPMSQENHEKFYYHSIQTRDICINSLQNRSIGSTPEAKFNRALLPIIKSMTASDPAERPSLKTVIRQLEYLQQSQKLEHSPRRVDLMA